MREGIEVGASSGSSSPDCMPHSSILERSVSLESGSWKESSLSSESLTDERMFGDLFSLPVHMDSIGEFKKMLRLSTNSRRLSMALDQPHLLRAVESRVILSRGGSVLKKIDDDSSEHKSKCEDYYAMSFPVESLDVFVSHCWAASRTYKYIALCMYFNLTPAAGLAHFSVLLCMMLELLHINDYLLGDVALYLPDDDLFPLIGGVVFLVALFLIQSLSLGWVGGVKRCFFDRCCVHQTDSRLKREGIESLGGFISMSDRFLLLWTPEYFTRLWCVFEVACFLKKHKKGTLSVSSVPGKTRAGSGSWERRSTLTVEEEEESDIPNLNFVHVSMRVFALGLFILNTLVLWVYENKSLKTLMGGDDLGTIFASIIQYFTILGMSFAFAPVVLEFAREHRHLFKQCKEYSLSDAECSHEADRTLVLGAIEESWGEGEMEERGEGGKGGGGGEGEACRCSSCESEDSEKLQRTDDVEEQPPPPPPSSPRWVRHQIGEDCV